MSMYDMGGSYEALTNAVAGVEGPREEPWQCEFPLMGPEEGPSPADEEEYQAMVRKYVDELNALRGPREY